MTVVMTELACHCGKPYWGATAKATARLWLHRGWTGGEPAHGGKKVW